MPAPDTALTPITLTIFNLNGLLTEWGNHFAKPHGLTTAHWQVLGAVALAPSPPNVPQIAHMMGITRQGTLKQVNALVADGLLLAVANPTHKRSPLYKLSPHGEQVFANVQQAWDKHTQALAPQFTPEELATTLTTLQKLTEIYQHIEE